MKTKELKCQYLIQALSGLLDVLGSHENWEAANQAEINKIVYAVKALKKAEGK